MLCHVILCYVMLCYVALCCVMIHYVVLGYIILCPVLLCCVIIMCFGILGMHACAYDVCVCVCTFLTISTSLYIHTWCLSEWVTTSVTTGLRVPGGNKQVSLHPQIGRNIP